ncbi:MAG: hypothetical protein IJZ24_03785 [Clostridia bacterium]|nr:hypothetical protein [Clostridia bacterium]
MTTIEKYLFRSLYTKRKERNLFLSFLFGSEPRIRPSFSLCEKWVRIPHPKIDKLACQAQGVGIFAIGEYPSSDAKKRQVSACRIFLSKPQ